VSRRADRVADFRASALLECDARLGVTRVPGRPRERRTVPSLHAARDARWRGPVRSALDLAANDGGGRRGNPPRPRRLAIVAVVLPRRAADRAVRTDLSVVEPTRAVSLGRARLPDAVPTARRRGRTTDRPANRAAPAVWHRYVRSCGRGRGRDGGPF